MPLKVVMIWKRLTLQKQSGPGSAHSMPRSTPGTAGPWRTPAPWLCLLLTEFYLINSERTLTLLLFCIVANLAAYLLLLVNCVISPKETLVSRLLRITMALAPEARALLGSHSSPPAVCQCCFWTWAALALGKDWPASRRHSWLKPTAELGCLKVSFYNVKMNLSDFRIPES